MEKINRVVEHLEVLQEVNFELGMELAVEGVEDITAAAAVDRIIE